MLSAIGPELFATIEPQVTRDDVGLRDGLSPHRVGPSVDISARRRGHRRTRQGFDTSLSGQQRRFGISDIASRFEAMLPQTAAILSAPQAGATDVTKRPAERCQSDPSDRTTILIGSEHA